MVNYKNGKIYKITSESTGLVYYGSTSEKYLSQRLSSHLRKYKRYLNEKSKNYCSSFKVIEQEDYKIELIKDFPCNNKTQLTTEEGNYVRENECVNIQIPGRTRKEYREQNKQKNKDRKSKPYTCECGSLVRWGGKLSHFKTKKHCEYINTRLH